MRSTIMTLAALLSAIAFSPADKAEARGNDGLYRSLIARHCVAVNRDSSERFTEQTGYIHKETVRIQNVRRLSGNWIRVYGMAQSSGRVAIGHMDYNKRTGRVRCPSGNFIYNHLPIFELLTKHW